MLSYGEPDRLYNSDDLLRGYDRDDPMAFDEGIKQFEANSRDDEQIHGGDVLRVVIRMKCTIPDSAAQLALTMYLATLD